MLAAVTLCSHFTTEDVQIMNRDDHNVFQLSSRLCVSISWPVRVSSWSMHLAPKDSKLTFPQTRRIWGQCNGTSSDSQNGAGQVQNEPD